MLQTTKELKALKQRYEKLEESRRNLQKLSADAQRLSKQAIFSIQRNNLEEAKSRLSEAFTQLRVGQKLTKSESRLLSEGIWRASLEEFAEAVLFFGLATGEELETGDLLDDPSILLGGLSDAIGELVRLAVREATEGNVERVEEISKQAEGLVEFLTSMDLTGGLRSKGDQARQHLRRLEDVRYDLSLRV